MTNSIFGFGKPEDSPGFLLWQTTIIWQRLIKKSLESYDISHAQFVILAVTLWLESKKCDVSQSMIIDHSKLDKMAVSKSLRNLVTKGYVKRAEHKVDTRAKSVCLTKEGKKFISKLVPIIEKIDSEFFGVLKKENQSELTYILEALVIEKH